MATFKVGQRVRVVRANYPRHHGCEVVITAIPHPLMFGDCEVECEGELWWANFSQLAPLTDPKAEAFLESIRKMKPLHEEPKREPSGLERLTERIRRELPQ